MLTAACMSLGIAAVCWSLLVNDSHIAMTWSNSMCWLSPGATAVVIGLAYVCAAVGVGLAGLCAALRPARRALALAVLALHIFEPIAAGWADDYVTRRAEAASEAR